MKVQIHRLLILAAVFFSFSSSRLFAQPVSPVHPGNLPVFVADMDAYFNGIMEIPLANITSYLYPLLPTVPNPCGHPVGITHTMNNTSISLDWPDVPSANQYRIGYLNLKTGASAVVATANSQHTFSPLPNGFYLFSFQAKCGNVWGKASIIVVEKVVELEVNDNLDCTCNGPEETPLIDSINYLEHQAFQLILKIGLAIEYIIYFRDTGEPGPDGYPLFQMNPDCLKDSYMAVRYGILYPASVNGARASLTFAGAWGNLAVNTNTDFPYSIFLKYCDGNRATQPANHLPENQQLTFYPNPVGDDLDLVLPPTMGQAAQIEIIDLTGKQHVSTSLEQAPNAQSQRLDLKAVPPGIYLLKVQAGGQLETRKFIKL